jgi:hypothetical protein
MNCICLCAHSLSEILDSFHCNLEIGCDVINLLVKLISVTETNPFLEVVITVFESIVLVIPKKVLLLRSELAKILSNGREEDILASEVSRELIVDVSLEDNLIHIPSRDLFIGHRQGLTGK